MPESDVQPVRPAVFLLGAGFSRAVSGEMPLMPELGTAVAQAFSSDPRLKALLDPTELSTIESSRVPLGDVEVWLSALTTDQPFLTASENLQRRALAAELSVVIARFVDTRQATVQSSPMPHWLSRLVAAWHFGRSAVITLNYDTLIESAVHRLMLRSSESAGRAMAHHVLGDVPPLVPARRWGHEDVPSFRLFKLHGSTNWFGRAEGNDIFSIVRDDDLLARWPTDDEASKPTARTALIRGLSPLIMPPTANKASLYANATMAGIWQSARQALSAAPELIVFGYSLPTTDTSLRAFCRGVSRTTRPLRSSIHPPSASQAPWGPSV